MVPAACKMQHPLTRIEWHVNFASSFFAVMQYTDLANVRIVFSTLESIIFWIVDLLQRNTAAGRSVLGSPKSFFGMRW